MGKKLQKNSQPKSLTNKKKEFRKIDKTMLLNKIKDYGEFK